MSTTLRLPRLSLFDAFESLFGATRTKSTERSAEEALAHMPPHLRADAGLPPSPSQEPEHPALTKARSRGRNWG